MSEYAIETINLTKEFTRKTPSFKPNVGFYRSFNEGRGGRFLALNDVNLRIRRGEIFSAVVSRTWYDPSVLLSIDPSGFLKKLAWCLLLT